MRFPAAVGIGTLPAVAGNQEKTKQDDKAELARARLSATGRNDTCPCGSGKKYKKCHLAEDEAATAPPVKAPDPDEMLAHGWQLFEQRRPGAAEKEFRAALALRPEWPDALVGIGLARLQTGDNDGARKEFTDVQRVCDKVIADLRSSGAKDAFSRREAQAYIRASHALGCMAFDNQEYENSLADLERVYAIDEGPVGTEARLIAGTALLKLKRAADARAALEPAAKSATGAGRAHLSLSLVHFVLGDRAAAETEAKQAMEANPHLAKVLLGRVPTRPANLGAATPGSREEAYGYAQTYGDIWDDEAKAFLGGLLEQAPTSEANAG